MKRTVAVIFGGRSAEHDISIITGQFILAALAAAPDYQAIPIYIAKDGKWYSHPSLAKLETFQNPNFADGLAKLKLPQKAVDGRFELSQPGVFSGKQVKVDVVFPALHGTYGEDGSLMGLLRLSNVAFVGCDLQASAVAMDKVLTKLVTTAAGIPSVPYVWFNASDWHKSPARIKAIIRQLKSPWFVKPAHLGSSIGVSRAKNEAELENAIEVALHYDDKVIVEKAVTDLTEVNCAILGNGDELTASLLEQPVFKDVLLSFEDKYIGNAKKKAGGSMAGDKSATRIPAPISATLTKKIQAMAKAAFRAIGGSGTARLDFMIDNKTKQAYLNEINPLPGSLQQHLWKASGVSNLELVTKLVELAQERFAAQQKLTTTFKSSVLQQSGGNKNLQ